MVYYIFKKMVLQTNDHEKIYSIEGNLISDDKYLKLKYGFSTRDITLKFKRR